mmetsp:Transcript_62359/g.184526  ORF Transcript_62359/g.184526 Transcript_62359/m.184526 type:complete len:445 (-) Transcript_62359:405-1739(-)
MNECGMMIPAWTRFLCLASLAYSVTSLSCIQTRTEDAQLQRTLHSRRTVLRNGLVVTTGGSLTAFTKTAEAINDASAGGTYGASQGLYSTYRIQSDASAELAPTLDSVLPSMFLDAIAMTKDEVGKGGTCWLGEHHSSKSDHALQAEFIRSIFERRKERLGLSCPPMAIGLEQVQKQFQPALDDFIAGKISLAGLRDNIQWDKRWVWPFEVYQDIFLLARELRISMIAMNVDSEDLGPVEREGYPALGKERLRRYIKDPVGFADFSKPLSYKTYVDYVIKPSYDLHKDMGLLRSTITGQTLQEDMSFRNFFSGRILWDEAMASSAYEWTSLNPGGLFVGLVGADHIKFRDGVPGRYVRMVADRRDSVSVLLNPTLIDTRPSGSVSNFLPAYSTQFPERLTLQLRYLKEDVDESLAAAKALSNTGGVLPLADYIVVSNPVKDGKS